MTSMLSIILALMLTLGGSPAVNVSTVNCINPGFAGSQDITEKPRLGEFLKIYPVGIIPNAQNPRLLLNLGFHYEKSSLMNLYQSFGMNPINFTDPFGENVYIEVTPSGSGMKDRLSLGQFWYALRKDYSRKEAISILRASQGYGPITDEQIMALEVGAMTQPFKVYVGGAGLMMFEWSPAGFFKDLVSMPFGKDFVYDTKLEWYEYGLTATGVGGKLFDMFKIGKVAKLGDNIFDVGNLKPISKADMAENFGAGVAKSGKISNTLAKVLGEIGFEATQINRIVEASNAGKPVVVIGETMDRVERMSSSLKKIGIKVKTYNPRNFTGLSRNSIEANRSWVRYWAKEKGVLFIDIGTDVNREIRSPFYLTESRSLYENWKYKNILKIDPGF